MRLYFIGYDIDGDSLDQFVIAPSRETALDLWATAWELDSRERENARIFEIKAAKIENGPARVLDWDGADIVRVSQTTEH